MGAMMSSYKTWRIRLSVIKEKVLDGTGIYAFSARFHWRLFYPLIHTKVLRANQMLVRNCLPLSQMLWPHRIQLFIYAMCISILNRNIRESATRNWKKNINKFMKVHFIVCIQPRESDVYASVNHTTIGSNNFLLLVWYQTIIWNNTSLLLIGNFWNKLRWKWITTVVYCFGSVCLSVVVNWTNNPFSNILLKHWSYCSLVLSHRYDD